MYLTNFLNDIHRIQNQMGNSLYHEFPAVQIYSNADQLIVTAEVPGLNQDEIQLKVSDDVLSISGEINKNQQNESLRDLKETAKVYRQERKTGKFHKTIELPYSVDGMQSEAVLKNGILTITFPLREEAKPRQISIKSE
ncbi:MAG: Hsp20/alpha crystallin family protein [Spirochaetia bacterium]|nr:Hsp20/alpha crystallin family protein [Spirochaetia bacterium]